MYDQADTSGAEQQGNRPNPAAPQVQVPSVLRGLLGQFGNPAGLLGGVAGLLMGRTANDDRWVVDLLDVQPADRVLDVGCGPGVTLQLLAEHAYLGFVTGVDPSDVMLRQARRHNRNAVAIGRIELQRASARQLPYPDGSFNKACAVHSIYFWPSLDEGLRELLRVLAPGGRLVLAVRMRHENASRFDPSRYGLTGDDIEAIETQVKTVGFHDVAVERQDGLDRQTMMAIIAHK